MDRTCENLIAPGLIDSWLKLQLLLVFQRHPHLCGEARRLTHWCRESPWALREALDALVDASFLDGIVQQGCTLYRLESSTENRLRLDWLAAVYEDPFRRDEIYALVRAAHDERQFRMWAITVEAGAASVVW